MPIPYRTNAAALAYVERPAEIGEFVPAVSDTVVADKKAIRTGSDKLLRAILRTRRTHGPLTEAHLTYIKNLNGKAS